MKDPTELRGVVLIESPTLDDECTLGPPKVLCIAANATIAQLAGLQGAPGSAVPLFGPTASMSVCYARKCPRAVPPASVNGTDMSGSRLLTNPKPWLVCAPATMAPLSDCEVCDGQCPTDQVCLENFEDPFGPPFGGCLCVPGTPCRDQPCPDPGQTCEQFANDTQLWRECAVVGSPPCSGADAPTCDGVCDGGSFCAVGSFGRCECVTPPVLGVPCGSFDPAPNCSGLCPPETPVCADVNGACTCTR